MTKILIVSKNISISYFFQVCYGQIKKFTHEYQYSFSEEDFPAICNSTKSFTCKIKTCQKTLPWSSGSRQCCNGMTYCTFYLWCAVHLRGLGTAWTFNMKCYWYVRIKSYKSNPWINAIDPSPSIWQITPRIWSKCKSVLQQFDSIAEVIEQ